MDPQADLSRRLMSPLRNLPVTPNGGDQERDLGGLHSLELLVGELGCSID
jgi:hypothetical protein